MSGRNKEKERKGEEEEMWEGGRGRRGEREEGRREGRDSLSPVLLEWILCL